MGSGPRKSSAGDRQCRPGNDDGIEPRTTVAVFIGSPIVLPPRSSFRGGEAEPGTHEHHGFANSRRSRSWVPALARARPGTDSVDPGMTSVESEIGNRASFRGGEAEHGTHEHHGFANSRRSRSWVPALARARPGTDSVDPGMTS